MTTPDRGDTAAIRTAMVAAGAMIAFQVGGRATRDALFLSNFDVTQLPRIVAVASAISLLAAFGTAKALARWGPARLVPALFAASALGLLLEFALLRVAQRPAALLVYIHIGALGALLVSSFWSLLNERFDPRTAKRAISRIGSAATVGGVAGGLLAERTAALLSVPAMLPMLGAVHLACALLVLRIGSPSSGASVDVADQATDAQPLRTLASSPYLRTLAAVVLCATISEGLLDYVFKAGAQADYGRGPELLRVFALFYTSVNLLAVALQALAGRQSLERLGLARTASILPWTVAGGGTIALLVPGLPTALFAKGAEAVVRNSLYRSGCELLLTPLPPGQKRAVKPLLDVGAVRIGDMLAAALVQLALFAWALHAPTLLLLLAVASAAAGIMLTFGIHRGYVATLERNLLNRAVQLDLSDITDSTTRETLVRIALPMTMAPRVGAVAPDAAPDRFAPPRVEPPDPVVTRLADLRSRDPARVRQALATPLEPDHVPHTIQLLAWDDVARIAGDALAEAAPRHTGQLVDVLLDPDADFAIRRRVSAPLAQARNQRAADGLMAGLHDPRFEVRYRCGLALAKLTTEVADLVLPPERTYAAILRELDVDRRVWESQRLLERTEDDPLQLGNAVRERASRSLEHVFTVLALVLPRRPLLIAFRGLHAEDAQLRGTALEYLETALPPAVRDKLWPLLGDSPPKRHAERPLEQVVGDLIKSNDSIVLHLEAVRRRPAPG